MIPKLELWNWSLYEGRMRNHQLIRALNSSNTKFSLVLVESIVILFLSEAPCLLYITHRRRSQSTCTGRLGKITRLGDLGHELEGVALSKAFPSNPAYSSHSSHDYLLKPSRASCFINSRCLSHSGPLVVSTVRAPSSLAHSELTASSDASLTQLD